MAIVRRFILTKAPHAKTVSLLEKYTKTTTKSFDKTKTTLHHGNINVYHKTLPGLATFTHPVKTGLGKTTKTHISWAKLFSDFIEKFTWVNPN